MQNGPNMTTMDDAALGGFQSLLSMLSPDLARFLGPAAYAQLKRMFGVTNDVMWDTVLTSDMTPGGTGRMIENRLANSMANRAIADLNTAAKQRFYQGLSRTLTSEKAWSEMTGPSRGASYDAYIEAQTQRYMGNWGFNTLYNFIDPLDVNAATRPLGMAAGNMIRQQLWQGNRNAFVNTREVISNLFRDARGGYAFDKRDYGYMGEGEVSALVAALSKDTDFLQGADVSKAGSLKEATDRLRNTTKAYADALSPLKDVFGKDVPSMIRSIEEMSGQSLSQLTPERAKQIATAAVNNTATGHFSMGELSSISAQYAAAMKQMGVSEMNQLNSSVYATSASASIYGGSMPRYMTRMGFTNQAASTVLRAANSRGADEYEMAYAIWAQRARQQGQGASFEEFRRQVDAAAGENGNVMGAILQVAGVNNRWDLLKGRSLDDYQLGKEAGIGADFALEKNFDRMRRYAMTSMSRDSSMQQALGDLRGGEANAATVRTAFDNAMKVLSGDATVIDMQQAQRNDAVARSLYGSDFSRLTDAQQLEVQSAGAIMNRIKTDPIYKDFYAGIAMESNRRQQRARVARIEENNQFAKTADAVMASSWKELITEVGGLKSGEGYKDGAVKAFLSRNAELSKFSTKEAYQDFTTATEAGALFTANQAQYLEAAIAADERKKYMKEGETFKEWQKLNPNGTYEQFIGERVALAREKRLEEDIKDAGLYAIGSTGLSNKGYREYLGKFRDAKTPEERLRMASMMAVYKRGNSDAIDEYFKGTNAAQRLAKESQLASDIQTGGYTAALNRIENDSIRRRLEPLGDRVNEYAKLWLNLSGTDGIDSTALQKKIDAERAELQKQLKVQGANKDDLNARLESLTAFQQAINTGSQGQTASGSGIQDTLQLLTNALKELVAFLKGGEDLKAKTK